SYGQFAGKMVRAELYEIQKADLGRKYAKVDRRSIEPPPVVVLRLFEVDPVTGAEHEIDSYHDIVSPGFLCSVDLLYGSEGPMPVASDSSESQAPHPQNYHAGSQNFPGNASNLTNNLVGSRLVQPCKIELDGKKVIVFVFTDLAVKIEGIFRLRYRMFDLFAMPTDQKMLTIQAEYCGGEFRIYSTKDFPGLPPSTDLTKRLAVFGVKLNVRETERKRKKRGDSDDLVAMSSIQPSHR
ncbi:hypothetical protein FISHEDRAFT_40615, partial [Fistulina hepatica ATCC 64428]